MKLDKASILKEIKSALKNKVISTESIDVTTSSDNNINAILYILKEKMKKSKTKKELLENVRVYKKTKSIINSIDETTLKIENEDGKYESKMLKAQLFSIIENASELLERIDEYDQIEDWIQSKITIAEDYVRTTNTYIKYYEDDNEYYDELIDYQHEEYPKYDIEEEPEYYDADLDDDLNFISKN